METLKGLFMARVDAFLERTGVASATLGRQAVTLILVLPIGTNFEAFSKGRSVEIEHALAGCAVENRWLGGRPAGGCWLTRLPLRGIWAMWLLTATLLGAIGRRPSLKHSWPAAVWGLGQGQGFLGAESGGECLPPEPDHVAHRNTVRIEQEIRAARMAQ